jgi:CheY-like chemotaxis protein/anti-sigma regulatory factor (Ser/Thr protein kinase)
VNLRNLLVVDDDPAVVELLTSILRRDDRHVVGAHDGDTAFEELQRAQYDLVVAGGRNGMDGLEFLRRIHQVYPSIPVIVTAETCDRERVVRAVREHAYSYFRKPLPPGAVADMAQQALDTPGWEGDIEILSADPDWISAAVRCKLDACDRMAQFLREAEGDLAPAEREDIVMSFRELLNNAIEHGGHSDPSQRVRCTLVRTRRAFVGAILDPGRGFSMKGLEHAAISNPEGAPTRHVEVRAEQGQRPGGFGILMVRSMVDELCYNEHGNEVMFVKYLS